MTSSASITAQRAITAGYSDSYYGTGTVAMVLSKNSESIDSWEKINSSDIKVAVTLGTVFEGEAKKSLCKITFASKKEISINDKLETADDKKSAGEILNLVKINNEKYNSLAVLRKDMLNKNLTINGATVEIMEQVTKND